MIRLGRLVRAVPFFAYERVPRHFPAGTLVYFDERDVEKAARIVGGSAMWFRTVEFLGTSNITWLSPLEILARLDSEIVDKLLDSNEPSSG